MKKYFVLIAIVFALTVAFFTDCGSKNKPSAPIADNTAIPWADSICYSRHILPLLNSRCAPCHVGQTTGGMRVDSYDLAKANIDLIIARTEAGIMPKGGPALSTEQVDTLKAWRQNGEKQCTF